MNDVNEPNSPDEKRYWLDNPANVRKFIRLLVIACAVLFVLDLLQYTGLLDRHGHYGVENWTGFYSFYGFIGCSLIVLTARALRPLLMRREDYYDR